MTSPAYPIATLIADLLRDLRNALCQRLLHSAPRTRYLLAFARSPAVFITSTGVPAMRLTTEQFVTIALVALTASGNTAALDGNPVFASSDEAVARIETDEDGVTRVIAVAPGIAQITATADADLDADETREITASGVIEVVLPEADTLELRFGDAEQQA